MSRDPDHIEPSTHVARFLARLGSSNRSGSNWSARCPAHDDRHPSLSISVGADDRILLHCHVGCSVEEIVGSVGMTLADLFPESVPVQRLVALFDYNDEESRLLYQVCRYEPKDFRARRPVGSGWEWNLRGVRRVPYRLPELLAADATEMVLIAEGEKDVDRLRNLGFVATTNDGGAGRWRPEFAAYVGGHPVAVLVDNDDPGREGAARIAASVMEAAANVRVIELPGLPPKGDVSDWLDRGGTADELTALIDSTPLWIHSAHLGRGVWAETDGPSSGETSTHDSAQTSIPTWAESNLRFQSAREFAASVPASVEWIANPYVAAGAITQIEGKIKVAGKTTFVTHLCRAVLGGDTFLGVPTTRTAIVYLTEQPPSSMREALARADLLEADDLRLLAWRDAADIAWPTLVHAAVAECRRVDARLLVVDTLSRFAGIRGDGENSAGEADAAMAPLQRAAADGLGIIVVRHERKAGGDVADAGRGSSAFGGAVDIVLSLRRVEGGGNPNARTIQALSRYDATPDSATVELTPEGYIPLGDIDVAYQRAMTHVLAALEAAQAHTATVEDLAGPGRPPRSTVQRVLDDLLSEGRLSRGGKGRRGDPYRFTLVTSPPSDNRTLLVRNGDGSGWAIAPWVVDDPDWVMGTA